MKSPLRRGISVLLVVAMVVSVFCAVLPAASAATYTTTIDGVTYSLNSSTKVATINGYVAGSVPADLVIPATVVYGSATYNVTTSAASAFKDCEDIVNVVLPASLTKTGNYLFRNCPNLKTVVFTGTTLTMGTYNFYNLDALESVVLPSGLTAIANNTFYNCPSLRNVTIPETVKTIGASAFRGTSALTEIQIPDGVTTMSGSAIFYGSGLKSIVLPAGVTTIGSSIFTECANLESVYCLGAQTAIPNYAFRYTGLKSFVIPESVTSLGSYAFNMCQKMTDLYIACDYPSSGVSDTFISDYATLTVYLSSKYAANWEAFTQKYYSVNFVVLDEAEFPTVTVPVAERYGFNLSAVHATVNDLPETVAANGSYTFTVSADTGFALQYVSVNGTAVTPDSTGVYTVENASATQNIVAVAMPETHSVTVSGSATMRIGGKSYTTYTNWLYGTDLTLELNASSGYIITGVTADGGTLAENEDGSYTLSAPYTDTVINVTTEEQPDWVVSFSGSHFAAMVNNEAVATAHVEKGGDLSFSLVPDEHYLIATVMRVTSTGPKTLTATDGVYTLTEVTANTTVSVVTVANTYGVTIDCGEHVTSSLTSTSCQYGGTRSFSLTFDEGYELDTITTTSGTVEAGSTMGTYVLSGVTEEATVTVTAKAYTPQELDAQQKLLTFTFNGDGTAVVSKCDTAIEGEVTIPATVQDGGFTYQVTSLASRAFYGCEKLTKVVLPDTLTTIGDYAFAGCIALTDAALPNSVVTIGNYVYRGCTSLTAFEIPVSVVSLGTNMFNGCVSLTNVTLHENLTEIPQYMFSSCHALASITLPGTIRSIGNYAFEATLLEELVLPEGFETLGDRVFKECFSLEKVTLPSTLKTIGKYAFWNCESLDNVILPAGLANLGEGAFSGCSSLSSITVPDGITVLNTSVFALCSSLSSVTLPDHITEISMLAFSNCSALGSIKLPSALKTLSNNVFQSCTALKSISIPAGVTEIGVACFTSCTALESVTFEGNNVTMIDAYAFVNTPSLTSITLPESLEILGGDAFSRSGLVTLHIPANVRSSSKTSQSLLIYPAAGCQSMTAITVDESNPYYVSVDGVLFSKKQNVLIQYPAGKADLSYQVPDTVLTIYSSAFNGASNLTSITLPDSVTAIHGSAFTGCTGVTAFDIPASVTIINQGALSFGTEKTDDLGNVSYETALEALVFHGDISNSVKNTDKLFFNLSTTTVFYPAGNESWTDSLETLQARYPNVRFVAYDEENVNPMNVHTVTFTADNAFAQTVAAEPEALETVAVREGDTCSFTVAAEAGYAVTAVKANGEPLSAGEDGVYTITVLADVEITIETVEAYYQVQFVSADGLAKIYNGATNVTGRTTRLQYGYSLTLRIVPDEHYEVAEVTLSAGTLTENENGTYTISGIAEDAVFTVTVQEVHEHSYECTEHKDPTCTEDGYDRYTCACGDTYDEVIDALGHDFGEWTTSKEATCTEPGEEARTCARCGETETRETEALGHDYQVTEHVDPTHTEDGYEIQTCSRCGDTVKTVLPSENCPSAAFTDVGLDLWYHSAVDFVVSHGHMNGIAADTFDPNGTATRAMLVTILHRASGEPKPTAAVPFTDVFAGAWYANAVAWAYNNEIVNGMTETTFAPDNSVTREQVAVILYRFAQYSGADVSARADLSEAFTDADDISGYATEALSWAVASGIINGYGETVVPQGTATRAELAAMLMRFLSE